MALRRLSASPWTLIMMIGVVGSRCEMISEAATPSMPGMLMSMTITSGRSSIAALIASSPESAVPHTSTSCSKLSSFVRWSRVSGMSSTIRTLITAFPSGSGSPSYLGESCLMMFGIANPYWLTSRSMVMPVVFSVAASCVFRSTAVRKPTSLTSFWANLITSAS